MIKKGLIMGVFLFILFNSILLAQENKVKNPGFEEGTGILPLHWQKEIWNKDPDASKIEWTAEGARAGEKCILIINNAPNDTRLVQEISVEENKKYRFSSWIKTENISQQGRGAIISILGTQYASKERRSTIPNWQEALLYISTGRGVKTVKLTIGLGGYAGISTGKAWFDDVSVEEVNKIPSNSHVANLPIEEKTDTKKSEINIVFWIIVFVIIVIVIIGLIFLLITLAKPKKKPDKKEPDKKKLEEENIDDSADKEDKSKEGDINGSLEKK